MIRKGIYSIGEVLSKIMYGRKQDCQVDFDGDLVYMNSQRYHLFFHKGVKCVCCGLEGKYFAKERNINSNRYHFNLYGIDRNGNEVLLTKDHIVPKSKGGSNKLRNYQTMCLRCNQAKGNLDNSIIRLIKRKLNLERVINNV